MYRFSKGVRHRLVLRHGSPLYSQVRIRVSGLIERWGGELGLFLEVQQGCQTFLSVATETLELHSSHCHGVSPYVELRGKTMYIRLTAGTLGFFSSFHK